MEKRKRGRRRRGKVVADIRNLYASDVCDIERTACPILFETRREWWDQECRECEKTRVEHMAEIGPWTRHILQLKFELEDCKIPYGVDDLSPEEWRLLGIVSRETKAIEAERRIEAERKRNFAHGGPGFL